jgi:hypothetical protein
MRILGRSVRPQVRLQPAQRVPALFQDVHDVDRHAASQGQSQGLHRRRACAPVGIDDDGNLTGAAAEAEVAVPGQLDLDGRLALSQAGSSWP